MNKKLFLQAIIKFFFGVLLVGLLVFLPAGTLRFPDGWLFMGILFLVIGNYLPKCKQNYTIGIKLPWTLNDEENWNKTHRFAGVVWTICSIVIIVGSFFNKGAFYTTFPSLFVMVFAPLIYSYIYYRKHR